MSKILLSSKGRVGVIQLNDPESLNCLDQETLREILRACEEFDQEPKIGTILIQGHPQAFSAGGDISEMAEKTSVEAFSEDLFQFGQQVLQVRKPMIAAVRGYALGGGCELALACDIIVAGKSARFGQPEIKLGIIPGMGGTQRLTRAIGKYKAMDMCLSGRLLTAKEAEQADLVSRVVPDEQLEAEALELAKKIAEMPLSAALMAKEAINASFESTLSQGLLFERRSFHSLFATTDQKEGMRAFQQKRVPKFTNK